ncbi:major facilitator superfamily transporter [Ameyamaea chiangmaiensis NBRC 103196]|uniref:MFS transporter n=1 Tax=Ameyamaea chiangmaiensis TaxID=442969 RepID=A0A850PD27_9PROT|nr:MFS transporter [Ameyamaea chiangmaiensis]MBS4075741.1 MFS transporter [Ameyamaea chiangmaiensis]NVN40803.1 MFS transporter [Ameyamaea chiangmaiensis]GBQ70324.1 major facilitator superfamily transporter [Ameyamaea chiangmaiensis NBRC 103196]
MPALTTPLSRSDVRTLALASLGGALEFYDFVIFAFFAKVIAAHFFPPSQAEWLRQTQTFGLFGAGYLARPLGGVVMAHFGDLLGRKRMFTLSVLLMALPTLAIGLLPDFATLGLSAPLALLALRIAQGVAIGGEAPGGWVFVAEHAGPRRTGTACGLLSAGLTAGILLGALVSLILHGAMTEATIADWGWRVPFVIGGVFGLLAMVLRRWLRETPVFVALHEQGEQAREMPMVLLLRHHRRAIVLSMVGTWTLTAAIIVLLLMMPALLQTLHHIPAGATLRANLAGTCALTLGTGLAGIASDRWGMRRVLPPVCLLLVIGSYALYGVAPAYPALLVPCAVLAGLGGSYVGLLPVAMVRAFPAAVRFSGLSLSYNVAYAIFGGLTPAALSALVPHAGLAPAHYVALAAVAGFMAVWRMPRSEQP